MGPPGCARRGAAELGQISGTPSSSGRPSPTPRQGRMVRLRVGLIAFVLLVAVGIAGAVVWALFQTPDFYREELTRSVTPAVRQTEARVFIERTQQLVEDVRAS